MLRLLIALAGMAVAARAQEGAGTIAVSPVSRAIVDQRLDAYVTKNELREPAVHRLFEDAGCTGDNLVEQTVKRQHSPNLICTLPGAIQNSIVVGAHFDFVEEGYGVVDNWTGAALLASLYEGLAKKPRRHTFRFVSFTGEEKGLVGSEAYVKQLKADHEQVSAMVNMDTLGLGETEVWVSHADPALVHLMEMTAQSVNLPVSGMNVDHVGSTDSESFRKRKIPAITIHSLTPATLYILHSPQDGISAVHRDAYYRTYLLVLNYLAVLDQKPDESPR